MKSGLTELIFILDKSGSMQGQVDDTIGGFNSFVDQQKAVPGECRLTTVLFDTHNAVLHDRLNLQVVPPLTRREYSAGGSTALIDALGTTITRVGQSLAATPEMERPEKVMVVIITDGEENASRQYSLEQVRQIITEQTEKYGWEFIFLGANIDAVSEAGNYGIDRSRARNFHPDRNGYRTNYDALSFAATSHRMSAPGTRLRDDWAASIDADYYGRGNNGVDPQQVLDAYLGLAKRGRWGKLMDIFAHDDGFARACAAFAKPGSQWTFLHQAAFQGEVAACAKLAELGASRDALTVHNESPADVAAQQGYTDLAAALRQPV